MFENIVLWKSDGPLPHTHSLFLTHTTDDRDLQRAQRACDEYFIYFNGMRKRRKMSGSSEAKHGLSLQTALFANKAEGGEVPDKAGPIPGRGRRGQQCGACLL